MSRLLFLQAVFWVALIATFPSFYFFNPFAGSFSLLAVLQTIFIVGWATILVLPLIEYVTRGLRKTNWLLIGLVLILPSSLLAIRIYSALVNGDAGLQYLVTYPIFILSDIVGPALIAFWLYRDNPAEPKGRKSLEADTAREAPPEGDLPTSSYQ